MKLEHGSGLKIKKTKNKEYPYSLVSKKSGMIIGEYNSRKEAKRINKEEKKFMKEIREHRKN